MPTASHYRARVAGTLGAAGAHSYLATIGSLGLLNYTVPTEYSLIDEVAAEPYWAWIHAVVALALVGSLWRPTWKPLGGDLPVTAIACSLGFAMMFSWAFFNLLWGLSTVRPVSLAGPGLALIVAAGEQLLANAWTRGIHNKGR
jgi:hypothetical protein